jgi:acetoin utilization deacetylase AcuC-like enzyme
VASGCPVERKFSTTMQPGLIHDPCFKDHATGRHPERPERIESIEAAFKEAHILEQCLHLAFEPATPESLCKVHRKEMVDRVFATSARGGGFLDPDTIVSGDSARVATQAAGAGLAAVQSVLSGQTSRALCVVRPPGHHATPSRSMGFCLFNNVAVSVEALLASPTIHKVAILDFDVHHGNGTQDIFYERGDVFFLSLHQYPHYPGTGLEDECGRGAGQGTTLNFPLPGNVSMQKWFDTFKEGLDAVSAFGPDALLVSAGFDSHRLDPLGDFPLDEEAFHRIAGDLCELAGPRPLISILEGGYNINVLGSSVVAYFQGLR